MFKIKLAFHQMRASIIPQNQPTEVFPRVALSANTRLILPQVSMYCSTCSEISVQKSSIRQKSVVSCVSIGILRSLFFVVIKFWLKCLSFYNFLIPNSRLIQAKSVRINVSMSESLVKHIDAVAKRQHLSRSAFLAKKSAELALHD